MHCLLKNPNHLKTTVATLIALGIQWLNSAIETYFNRHGSLTF